MARRVAGDPFGRSDRDDAAARAATFGAEVDDPVGLDDHVQVVFDDDAESPSPTSRFRIAVRRSMSAMWSPVVGRFAQQAEQGDLGVRQRVPGGHRASIVLGNRSRPHRDMCVKGYGGKVVRGGGRAGRCVGGVVANKLFSDVANCGLAGIRNLVEAVVR